MLLPTREAKQRLWNFSCIRTLHGLVRFNDEKSLKFFTRLKGPGDTCVLVINTPQMNTKLPEGSEEIGLKVENLCPRDSRYNREEFINLQCFCHKSCYLEITSKVAVEKNLRERISEVEEKRRIEEAKGKDRWTFNFKHLWLTLVLELLDRDDIITPVLSLDTDVNAGDVRR